MSEFAFIDWFDNEIASIFGTQDTNVLKSLLETENFTTVSRLEELDVNNLPTGLTIQTPLKKLLCKAINRIRGSLLYDYITLEYDFQILLIFISA